MKEELLTMFEYAVENNMWDMAVGLYSEVVKEYKSDADISMYADKKMELINIRRRNRGDMQGYGW